MGVPKFYRWISERYPCLSEVVREYQIPDFDNLYLDMNGIIHGCSHPNDDDPHFRITEDKIFADICHYIECLFKMIRPKKVFFMAVDGVAPRAKMNQQRGRRFRSAREAEECEKRAVSKGEVLPTEERFDSNCITPGTEFMVKLQEHLKYFVTAKISTDKTWQGIRVYLSGHETPGEGEHKIMEFIRSEKSKPDYNPHTRHCLYGLDADLIMLGLCSHEPHFSLLREEINFARKKSVQRIQTPEEITFHLLHLSLLREYIDYEFSSLKDKLPFPYDIENIIDDWVLMGFLVGNDFIPHLPHMHIAHDALPSLYQVYIEVLPTLDGYINEGGYLNLLRFEKYLQSVSRNDYEQFEETFANIKWFQSKTGRSRIGHANPPSAKKQKTLTEDSDFKADNLQCDLNVSFSVDENDSRNATDLIGWEEKSSEDSLSDVDDQVQPEDPDLIEDEFTQHKRDYYIKKLAYEHVTPEVLREQAECYVSAIQWILHYYYNGVCSWSWYYPHHYAPYVSDVKDFHDMKLEFEIGTPFLPFEQLLAVLPAASKKFLPEPYQSLMCDANSPLIDYYPTEFETDLNGKQHSWEAIVLIPFIDEKRLLDAMKPIFEMVSKPEQDRNVHKPCLLYTYCAENLGKFSASALGNFPDVDFNHAKCEQLSLDSFYVERSKLQKGLCESFKRDMYIPGFPTLKHIPHKVCLKKAGVKVFQMPSRNNNMILDVEPPQTTFTDQEAYTIAQELIGNTVYVGWPHITEARVVSISTPKMRFRRSESSSSGQCDVVSETQSEDDLREWHCYNNVITDKYKDRWGVIIGRTQILVEAQIQMGKKYVHVQGDHIALEKQWSVTSNMYAYQTVIKSLDVFSTKQDSPKTLEDLYPAKSLCFLLSSQYYGRCAEVISCDSTGPRASIQLAVDLSEDPNLTPAITAHDEVVSRYFTTYSVAQRLGVSGHLLSRMMGTFQITRSGSKSDKKVNIGLNLKFNTRSKEVVGFSRRIGKDWTFSAEAMEAMEQYLNKFPDMFENINMNLSNRPSIPEDDIFPGEDDVAKLDEVLEFLKTLPCYTGQQQACGSVILEADIVKVVEDEVDKAKGASKKTAILNFSPRHIFSPSDCRGISLPDPTVTFELFDRVINIKESSTVPLGHKGTVIGIYPAEKMEDMTYDVVFDNEFPGGLAIRCAPNRGYRVSPYSVINITHGLRKENCDSGVGGQKPTAIVRPQTSQHNPAGVSSVYGKSIRSNANNKGPKFQYGRGRACPSGPSQAPTIVPRIGTSGATTIINPLALHTAICPAPPNLAQEYHFRKFNHSPNSPFVPRQACPPAATGPQPQFITPKVFTNTQFQLQYRQPPPLITVRQGAQTQESEFANLWMQLQMANTNPGTVKNRDDVKPPDKPLNVLINSAKSRPRNSPRVAAMLGMNPAVPCNSAPCPGGSRQNSEFEKVLHALQNITVQQQPLNKGQGDCAAVSHQQISSAATAQKPASVQELGSMSSSSSSAITKLLRPNEFAKEGKDAKKEENVSVKAQQSYGRSISVEELFRDAKETERQRQVQAQAQMQVALGPTTSLDNSSCVSVLEHFVYSYSRELPNYDCIMVGPSKLHVGRVILPDKRAYTGRPEASKKAAEESAAFVALNALGQPAPKLFPSNLRGLGPYSDNMLAGGVIPPGPPAYQRIPSTSASFQGIRFPSSVGSRANMRSNVPQHPFPHRQPGPGMQQVPMPYSNVHANMQGPYGNRNQGFHKPYQQDASRLGYGDQSGPRGRHQYQNQNQSFGSPNVSPQKPNAFVPLQVSRQQKSSSGKKASSYKDPISETRNDVHEAVAHASTANVQKETTNIPGNIHGNVLSGESQGRVKRRSSRLAVNFNKGE